MKTCDVMLVSHEASRTGAPKVALNTVEWLVKDAGLKVTLVARAPGPMLAEFKAAGALVKIEPLYWLRVILRRFRLTKHARCLEGWSARQLTKRFQPKIIYLNSVLSLSYAESGLNSGVHVISHLHETEALLEGGLKRYTLQAEEAIKIIWITCAKQANNALNERYPTINSLYWPSCVDEDYIKKMAASESPKLPVNFILGVGKANKGKGFDIWIRLCQSLAKIESYANIDFVWVGQLQDQEILKEELDKKHQNRFHFLGELKNPYPVMKKAMLLTVTSRNEASPLVTLEAQALGIPVVAVNVGDIKEQIPSGHIVKISDEKNLLQTVQNVLKKSPPELAFDSKKHGIAIARQRALDLIQLKLLSAK